MRILHTESSNNWGGQEIRILKEAQGMKERGHTVVLAVVKGGKLVQEARKKGFTVYEISFERKSLLKGIWELLSIIKKEKIDLVNTHSSLDAWMGGVAARLSRKKVIRTRHLSTPIRKGINSHLLYRKLADAVVTTSSCMVPVIREQANLPESRCSCIPTGVIPFQMDQHKAQAFRTSLGVLPDDILVGTVCVVRSWKGIYDLMQAADLLRNVPKLKWVVVGGGYIEQYKDRIPLEGVLTFAGHLDDPSFAFEALDIFTLLSTAHEGVSQSVLQAAFCKKPLITTPIGGLPEVCLDGVTGLIVAPHSPKEVAKAVMTLYENRDLRIKLGERGRLLVEEHYLFQGTIDRMEEVMKGVLCT